ncbi:MAG: hypothetical protein LIO85_02670 [Rikenellaceae bacterium]|nr:hypothetical protein [Rikenellaceae bacterium]
MKIDSIVRTTAIAAMALAAISCKVDDGTTPWQTDKDYTLVMDVNSVVDDYFTMARAGFATVFYEGATEEEKIIYENTALRGYTFRKLEKRWSVKHYERSYYIDIEYGPEGEAAELEILRSTVYNYDEVAQFDTCVLVNLGDGLWDLKVKNAVTPGTSYSYREGAAGFTFKTGEWIFYPETISVSGKGAYSSHLWYDTGADPVEVEWELTDGVVENPDSKYYSDLRRGVLDILAGPQGQEKERFRIRFDWDEYVWDAVKR